MPPEKENTPQTTAAQSKTEEAAAEAAMAGYVDEAGPSYSARPDEPPPPAYEPPPYEASASQASAAASAASPVGEPTAPTVWAPFNFPSDSTVPPYDSLTTDIQDQKPIAIPQLQAVPTAGFVSVYPPSLLRHGVIKATWSSFLDTVSAFLTAKVSDRAISHAGDMAKHFVTPHKNVGKEIFSHTKHVGSDIAKSAKKGDIFGATFGAIGGIVTIPIFTALGIAGAAASLPGTAIGAIVKKPQTPGQRAAAYAAVANKKWLHARGLHAQMLDSNELAQLLGVPVLEFLKPAQQTKDRSAAGQLQTLEGHIAPLEIQQGGATLELETNTIWLVLVPRVPEEAAATTKKSNSDSDSDSDTDESEDSDESDEREFREWRQKRREENRARRQEKREARRARRAKRGKRAA